MERFALREEAALGDLDVLADRGVVPGIDALDGDALGPAVGQGGSRAPHPSTSFRKRTLAKRWSTKPRRASPSSSEAGTKGLSSIRGSTPREVKKVTSSSSSDSVSGLPEPEAAGLVHVGAWAAEGQPPLGEGLGLPRQLGGGGGLPALHEAGDLDEAQVSMGASSFRTSAVSGSGQGDA